MTAMDPAGPKERFEVLLYTLRRYNERFVTGVIGVSGVFLVSVGWLVTSAEPIALFKDSGVATAACLGFVAFLMGVYYVSLTRVYRANRRAYEMLKALAYMEEEFYRYDQLPGLFYILGLAVNIFILGFTAALILNNYRPFLF